MHFHGHLGYWYPFFRFFKRVEDCVYFGGEAGVSALTR